MPSQTPRAAVKEAILFDVDGTLMKSGSWYEDGLGEFYPGVETILREFYRSHLTIPQAHRRYKLGFITGCNLARIQRVCNAIDPRLFDDGLWFSEMGIVAYLDGVKQYLVKDTSLLRELRNKAEKYFDVYEPHELLVSLTPNKDQPLPSLQSCAICT